MALTLSLNGIEVNIIRFLDTKLPRTIITPTPSIEFSLFGTGIGSGSYFDSKYLWTINALVDINQERNLMILYKEFEKLRTTLADARITLIDTNQEVQEITANIIHSVAPAPNNTVTEVGDYSCFFAEFNVWFTQSPDFTQEGIFRRVNFTLTEV